MTQARSLGAAARFEQTTAACDCRGATSGVPPPVGSEARLFAPAAVCYKEQQTTFRRHRLLLFFSFSFRVWFCFRRLLHFVSAIRFSPYPIATVPFVLARFVDLRLTRGFVAEILIFRSPAHCSTGSCG